MAGERSQGSMYLKLGILAFAGLGAGAPLIWTLYSRRKLRSR